MGTQLYLSWPTKDKKGTRWSIFGPRQNYDTNIYTVEVLSEPTKTVGHHCRPERLQSGQDWSSQPLRGPPPLPPSHRDLCLVTFPIFLSHHNPILGLRHKFTKSVLLRTYLVEMVVDKDHNQSTVQHQNL